MGRLAEERDSVEDHTGGAIAALEGALVKKCLLDGVEAAVLLEALDRNDVGAADASDGMRHERGDAVEQDGAGAALALAAAVVSASELEMVAEDESNDSSGAAVTPR